MDYTRIYERLISFRKAHPKKDGYFERHHILPKALGGSDSSENLVDLSAREHWIAHLLLHKIHKLPQTAFACTMMGARATGRGIGKILNSKMYESIKKECASITAANNSNRRGAKYKVVRQKNTHKYVCLYCNNEFVRSSKNRKNLKYCSRSCSMHGNKHDFGGKVPEEIRSKISNTLKSKTTPSPAKGKKKQIVACPFCGQFGSISNMHRWHFENCKKRPL